MISYIIVGMTLLSARIALLSGRKYRSSTKPCNLAQMNGLYNKSRERFMLSKCPENTPMDHQGQFKLYRDTTLVKVEMLVLYQF
jgi:hypothetical protein